MAEGRRFERVRLGVALAPPEVAARLRRSVGLDERAGLLVRGVVDGSPAAAAGIREGDLLTTAGDRELARPRRPVRRARPTSRPAVSWRSRWCAAPRS